MSSETKRLGIIATICFFPTAIAGWNALKKSEAQAAKFFRISIYIFLGLVLAVGLVVVIEGGRLIKPMGSFF